MPTPVTDTLKEVEATSKLIRGVGPVTTLSIAVLVLCTALGFTIVTAKVGGDRWTATDHREYVKNHDREEDLLVTSLLTDHNQVHREAEEADDALSANLGSIHEDVAVLKSIVGRMELDLQIIKTAVVKIERNGKH